MQKSSSLYICAAAKDISQAERLSALLSEKTGYTPVCVLCPEDYRQGEIPEDIIRQIKSCHLFFAIISRNALDSSWLADQMELASKIDLLTIPVQVDSFRLEGRLGIQLGTADCIHIDNELQMEKMLSNVFSWLNAQSRSDSPILAVDMALSVKWASCNLGSDFPDIPGDYYAWGEKSSRKSYGYRDYRLTNKDYYSRGDRVLQTNGLPFLKYNMDGDGLFALEAMDDPATLSLGAPWRLPTRNEFQELLDNCEWQWVENIGRTLNNNPSDEPCLNGYRVTSKANGNHIFLPAAGVNFNESEYESVLMPTFGRYGAYWARDLRSTKIASGLLFGKSEIKVTAFYREKGLCVRPVYDESLLEL